MVKFWTCLSSCKIVLVDTNWQYGESWNPPWELFLWGREPLCPRLRIVLPRAHIQWLILREFRVLVSLSQGILDPKLNFVQVESSVATISKSCSPALSNPSLPSTGDLSENVSTQVAFLLISGLQILFSGEPRRRHS